MEQEKDRQISEEVSVDTEGEKAGQIVEEVCVDVAESKATSENKTMTAKQPVERKHYVSAKAKSEKSKINFGKALSKFSPYNFVLLTIAGIINATGVTLLLTPVSLYDGGISGTSFLLSQLTDIPLSIFLIVLNLPFFIFGYKKMGTKFVVYSLYTIAIYSLVSFLYQYVFDIDFSAGSPLVGKEMILCALFGGIVSGIGSGLTIRCGGAIDGIEVAAVVFAKKLGLTVGSFVMIYNAIVYLIAGAVMQNWVLSLYSIVSYAVGLKAVDFVVDGLDRAKSAIIITDKCQQLADALSDEFRRGITVMNAWGHYSKTDKKVIYCVVNRFEVGKLKAIVSLIDPKAFVAISDVSDSLGSSVRLRTKKDRKSNNNSK
ncbi:MAG: YitT family protein [Christensenellales bacterium]